MNFILSTNKRIRGKDADAIRRGGRWADESFNVRDLLDWSYVQGYAITHGVFRDGERSDDAWKRSQLIIVDVDDAPEGVFDVLINDRFVSRHAALITPSSSYTAERPKFHVFFVLDAPVNVAPVYRYIFSDVAAHLPVKADRALRSTAQLLYGTVYTDPSMTDHVKHAGDGLVWVNDDFEPLQALPYYAAFLDERPAGERADRAASDAANPEVSRRAAVHAEQPYEDRVAVVLDALSYALDGWGQRDYEDWFALFASAWVGSDGDEQVAEYIVNHMDVEWSDGDKGRSSFLRQWERHESRDHGYTVATLFLMARQNGWLTRSSVEVPDRETEPFYAPEVGDWLDGLTSLPQHTLIMSPTGTGKTLGGIRVMKRLQAQTAGFRAVVLAPSIKLCYDLSATLERRGLSNTLYIDGTKTKDGETLSEATVLVTTLQTFAVKVAAKQADLTRYTFVMIDECDELISAFVRANTGRTVGYASHVSQEQSYAGVETLRRLFAVVPYVYLLDGTATRVTLQFAREHSPALRGFRAYRNTFRRDKAAVTMLSTLDEARKVAYDAAWKGERVVIATGTKREAHLMANLLVVNGAADPDEIIVITGDSHNDARVKRFFRNVNRGAAEHRVVIYNSAMGSGVSITDVRPDTFVQIADYINPRRHLQILNRYRQQAKVYVYVHAVENLYGDTIEQRLERLPDAVMNESKLTGLTFEQRSEFASLVTRYASFAIRDEYEQGRSSRLFYERLLHDDGRAVNKVAAGDVGAFPEYVKAARNLAREVADRIRKTWRGVDPIDRTNPPPDDMTGEDVARGLLHARIRRLFGDRVDDGSYDDETLARICIAFGRQARHIDRYQNPDVAVRSTLNELKTPRRALVTLKLYVSRLELLAQVGYLLPDARSSYVIEDTDPTAFLSAVESRSFTYDLLAGSTRNRYAAVMAKYDTDDERAFVLARVLLRSVGLRLRRKNGKRTDGEARSRVAYIDNADTLASFLDLTGAGVDTLRFDPVVWDGVTERIRALSEQFESMSPANRRRVLDDVDALDAAFVDAVDAAIGDLF